MQDEYYYQITETGWRIMHLVGVLGDGRHDYIGFLSQRDGWNLTMIEQIVDLLNGKKK
jgi:hypothetical protein